MFSETRIQTKPDQSGSSTTVVTVYIKSQKKSQKKRKYVTGIEPKNLNSIPLRYSRSLTIK